MYKYCNARTNDEGCVYVGVDNDEKVVYEVTNQRRPREGALVHAEDGLGNGEGGLHHCRKVEVNVEGVSALLLAEGVLTRRLAQKGLSRSS